jgi:hypothetical protein
MRGLKQAFMARAIAVAAVLALALAAPAAATTDRVPDAHHGKAGGAADADQPEERGIEIPDTGDGEKANQPPPGPRGGSPASTSPPAAAPPDRGGAPATPASSPAQLPQTGLDIGVVMLFGGMLLVAGRGLRWAVRDD